MRQNPVAASFLASQATQMPAYGAYLDEGEVANLWEYVQWVRAREPGKPGP